MRRKLHIGIDLDGTLVHFRKSPVREAFHRAGYLRASRSKEYDFSDVPDDVRENIWALFADPDYMLDLTIIPGTKRKLKEWAAEGHKLTLITARSDDAVRIATKAFVAEHFPQISDIRFVDLGSLKADLLKNLHLDIWVDDHPVDTVAAAKMGIYTCLISNSHTPYNQHVKGNHMLHTYAQVADINFR